MYALFIFGVVDDARLSEMAHKLVRAGIDPGQRDGLEVRGHIPEGGFPKRGGGLGRRAARLRRALMAGKVVHLFDGAWSLGEDTRECLESSGAGYLYLQASQPRVLHLSDPETRLSIFRHWPISRTLPEALFSSYLETLEEAVIRDLMARMTRLLPMTGGGAGHHARLALLTCPPDPLASHLLLGGSLQRYSKGSA